MAKSTERRGGRKIKYREEGKPVYLALSTPPPLYLFFHAFHRFFTHHRAPKAGVYQSPSLPSFLPPLFARQKLQTLVGTFLRVVIVRARSSHTLRRRVLCGGHSMPRRKIYDIAIRATIYYKIAISTPDIHPLSVRSRHSLRSHPLLLPFLPLRHELRDTEFLRNSSGTMLFSSTRFIYFFFKREQVSKFESLKFSRIWEPTMNEKGGGRRGKGDYGVPIRG